MIVKIKDGDFSSAGVGAISTPIHKGKLTYGANIVSLGTEFNNGDKLHFRFRIISMGGYDGTTIPFAFGFANTESGLNTFMFGAPHITIQNAQDGSIFYGDVVVSGLVNEKPYLQLAIYNLPGTNMLTWEVDVIKIN